MSPNDAVAPTAEAEFRRGLEAGKNPTDAGPTVTTTESPWLALTCPVCAHTFRVGDRVVTEADGRARHASAEGACVLDGSVGTVPHAVADAFLRGVTEGVGKPEGLTITVLSPGYRLLAGFERGFPRKRCPICAHTFRPNEVVVVCPCRPDAPKCEWTVHRDPGRGLLCWDNMQEAKTRCPLYRGTS